MLNTNDDDQKDITSLNNDSISPGIGQVRPAGQPPTRGPYVCSVVRAARGPAGRTLC